jgi:hypothetical protein
MTSEELTGTLQSRGQDHVVIEGQTLTVPKYVLDWMNNMQKPLQDGETVLYKKQQEKEGSWALTKIRRPPKSSGGKAPTSTQAPTTAPQIEHKIGVLISHHPTGCTVRMANGDRTYALAARFPAVELPQKIEGYVRRVFA